MELPPGFRFHPTDEELISHYLSPKALDHAFSAIAIGEVDLNECEPWDLPWRAKMGEKEWYFFCKRDRKYPTGLRTNRATEAGYWKATGKDREIFRGGALVGMKKTLVFYKGRAPRGEKSNWVMHEYRLHGRDSLSVNCKNEWAICRIFEKSTSGGNKTHVSEIRPASLPPLTDSQSHVTSISDNTEDEKNRGDSDISFFLQSFGSFPYGESGLMQNPGVPNMLLLDPDAKRASDDAVRRSFDNRNGASSSAGPVDLDCLWNF